MRSTRKLRKPNKRRSKHCRRYRYDWNKRRIKKLKQTGPEAKLPALCDCKISVLLSSGCQCGGI